MSTIGGVSSYVNNLAYSNVSSTTSTSEVEEVTSSTEESTSSTTTTSSNYDTLELSQEAQDYLAELESESSADETTEQIKQSGGKPPAGGKPSGGKPPAGGKPSGGKPPQGVE